MFIFLDTEFSNFTTKDLISIGLISEDESFEFYKEVNDFPINLCTDFVKDHILDKVDFAKHGLSYNELAINLVNSINSSAANEFVFVADYQGDFDLLQDLFDKAHSLNIPLTKKHSFALIGKGLYLASTERGFFNNNLMDRASTIFVMEASAYLATNPRMQHHALFDAKGNLNGWKAALTFLKK